MIIMITAKSLKSHPHPNIKETDAINKTNHRSWAGGDESLKCKFIIFFTVAANETCLLDRGRFDALALVKYGNLGPENHRKSDKNISHFPSPLHLPRIAGAWSVQQSTRAVNWTSRNFTMAGHCPYYHFQVEGLPLGTV